MSVGGITPDGDGSRLTLRIQGRSDPLPAFTATVASGQITGTTRSYPEVNVQDQLISAPASTLAPGDVDIPLRLNVTPDKVGLFAYTISSPPPPSKPSAGPARPATSCPVFLIHLQLFRKSSLGNRSAAQIFSSIFVKKCIES